MIDLMHPLHLPNPLVSSCISTLRTGVHTELSFGLSETDGVRVYKLFCNQDGGTAAFKRAQAELQFLSKIQLPFLLNAQDISLDTDQNVVKLEFDAFQGRVLAGISDLSTHRVVIIIQTLLHYLHQLHDMGMLFSGINARCVLISPDFETLRLINGFTYIASDRVFAESDTLRYRYNRPYAAPEMIGVAMGAETVDHRSDFYGLGILFYELLTGKPVCYCDDYIPILDDGLLDSTVFGIISKLTHRYPQHRYQSAYGIRCDLETYLAQLNTGGAPKFFLPGLHDRLERLPFKAQLYGREEILQDLNHQFEAVIRNNSPKLLCLYADPGVGKTAVVKLFLKRMEHTDGKIMIIQGKTNQFLNTPYTILIQFLLKSIEWVQRDTRLYPIELFTSNPEINASFSAGITLKQRVNIVLMPYGKLFCALVPEMADILTDQSDVPPMDPIQEKQRFITLLADYFRIFSDAGYALLFFADDLQWVDAATLDFLKYFLSSSGMSSFIIGTCRTQEVVRNHALFAFITDMKTQAEFCERFLGDLSLSETESFVSDLLDIPSTDSLHELVTDIYKRTSGNPLFLRQFLLNIWDQEYLIFDANARQWHWSLERIQQAHLHDSVADLVIQRIQNLPEKTRELLIIAALIGFEFRLSVLSHVVSRDAFSVALDLWHAVREDFIAVRSDASLSAADWMATDQSAYTFLHDRIQHAFSALISPEDTAKRHLQIANALCEWHGDTLFSSCNHFISGKSLIQTPDEKLNIVPLAVKAGQKAKHSSAFESAFSYFKFACDLLFDGHSMQTSPLWHSHYSLVFDSVSGLGETAYLNGQLDFALHTFDMALSHAQSLEDRTIIERHKISLSVTTADYRQAIAIGVDLLRQWGIRVPMRSSKLHALWMVYRARKTIRHPISYFESLQVMTDQRLLEVMPIIYQVMVPCYFVDLELFAYLASLMMIFSMRYGNAPNISFGYSCFSIVLAFGFHDYTNAVKIGRASMRLLETQPNSEVEAKSKFMFGAFISRWDAHLQQSIDYVRDAERAGLKLGDMNFVNYAISIALFVSISMGQNLEQILTQVKSNFPFVQKMKYVGIYYNLILTRLYVQILQGTSKTPLRFMDDDFDEDRYCEKLKEHITPGGFYYVLKLQILYLFEDYSQAQIVGASSDKILRLSFGMVHVQDHFVFYTLTLIKLLETDISIYKKIHYRLKIIQNIRLVKQWSEISMINYRHKFLLMLGEWRRYRNRIHDAKRCFEEAALLAESTDCLHIAALANELLWKLSPIKENSKYAQNAYLGYLKWGADYKAQWFRENNMVGF